ncbi:MAG: metallophosphoesterase [Chloroflexota bacterium]
MTSLHFAQVSDLHISTVGDSEDVLSGQAATLLVGIVDRLNLLDDLDFVLFSGDLVNEGRLVELELFQQAVAGLRRPYYVIPGNHDYRPPAGGGGLTRQLFAQLFNPQIADRQGPPGAQMGYWSLTVKPDVQLIGLDSIREDDWGGIIDAAQMAWLRDQLAAHADKLVIVAVHHPLHELAPVDRDPRWRKFVCHNGAEMLALLADYPQARLVLTAHHHFTKVERLGPRWHLACPAVSIYPCAYRTVRLSRPAGREWQLEWRTRPAATAATTEEARQRMIAAWLAVGLDREFVDAHVRIALGEPEDRSGCVLIGHRTA